VRFGVEAFTARLPRRRDAHLPRVVVRDRTGIPHALEVSEDPSAEALLEAAERLISAVQSGSNG
jgi:hypothetical protein